MTSNFTRSNILIPIRMKVSILALLCLAASASAAPNAAAEQVGNIDPFPIFHPLLPPWLHRRTTTNKPTSTTEEATTTTEIPTTTTEKLTTTKPHKTTTTTVKPTTTKPQKTTTAKPTTTTSKSPSTELPPYRGDYTLVGTYGYYKFFKEFKTTWAEAWEACIEDDAHLLVVRSQDEFTALYHWMPDSMPPYVYYGVHHRYVSQKFVTIFDEPLESIPYHTFGWDYSNATFFNNKDYPVVLIDLSISWGGPGIYLNPELREMYQFICKRDI